MSNIKFVALIAKALATAICFGWFFIYTSYVAALIGQPIGIFAITGQWTIVLVIGGFTTFGIWSDLKEEEDRSGQETE